MAQRREYTMSEPQLKELLSCMEPVPLIALQCGAPPSPQENANGAWARLGEELGFDSTTVKPTGKGDRFFTALGLQDHVT